MKRLGLRFGSGRWVAGLLPEDFADALKLCGGYGHGRAMQKGDVFGDDQQLPGFSGDEPQVGGRGTGSLRAPPVANLPEIGETSSEKQFTDATERNALSLENPNGGQLEEVAFAIAPTSTGPRAVHDSGRPIEADVALRQGLSDLAVGGLQPRLETPFVDGIGQLGQGEILP